MLAARFFLIGTNPTGCEPCIYLRPVKLTELWPSNQWQIRQENYENDHATAFKTVRRRTGRDRVAAAHVRRSFFLGGDSEIRLRKPRDRPIHQAGNSDAQRHG